MKTSLQICFNFCFLKKIYYTIASSHQTKHLQGENIVGQWSKLEALSPESDEVSKDKVLEAKLEMGSRYRV